MKFLFQSNSGFLQKIAPEDKNRANQNDPVSQLRDVLSIIADMAAERGNKKGNVNDLTEEECQNYENLMRQLEEEVRNHIGVNIISQNINITKFIIDSTTAKNFWRNNSSEGSGVRKKPTA